MPVITNPQPINPVRYPSKGITSTLGGVNNWGQFVSKFRNIDPKSRQPVRPVIVYRQPGKKPRRIKPPTMLTNAMAQGQERERPSAGNQWTLGRDQRVVQTWADQGKPVSYWPGQIAGQPSTPVRPQYNAGYWPYQSGKGPGYGDKGSQFGKGFSQALQQGKETRKGIGLQGVSDMIENIRARNEELELQFDMLRAEQEPEEPNYSYGGGGGYGGWGGWSGGSGSRGNYYNPYAWYWSLLNWRI